MDTAENDLSDEQWAALKVAWGGCAYCGANQGHRLLQVGVGLFLFTSLWGFAIPVLPAPRLGLSVHSLGAIEGAIIVGLGLVWPRLLLGERSSSAAFYLYIYASLATLVPYILAAIWGAGNSVIPLAAGTARGDQVQEFVITVILYSAAPTVLLSLALILWGLRMNSTQHPQSPVA